MDKFSDIAWSAVLDSDDSPTGEARLLASATVTVRDTSGNLATIYSDNGVTPAANPLTAGSDGEYGFYAANGNYDLTIAKTGYATETKRVSLIDPTQVNGIRYLNEIASIDTSGLTNTATVLNTFLASLPVGTEVRGAPGEIYGLTAQVLIGVAKIKLNGNGAKFAKLAGFSGTCMIRVAAANVAVENLEMDGLDKTTVDGIITSADVATGFTVKGCTIYNCQYGVSANSNSRIKVLDNVISLCSRSLVRIHNNSPTAARTDIKVSGNYFDVSAADAATYDYTALLIRGDETYPTTAVVVDGNTFVLVDNPTNSGAMGCECRFVVGGQFTNNTGTNGGMLVSAASSKRFTIDSNSSTGANAWAIEVAGPSGAVMTCDDNVVSNNTIDGSGRVVNGIGVQGSVASRGVVVTGNTIYNFTGRGVYVNTFWDDITISDNDIRTTNATGDQHGIWLLGSHTNAVIDGNRLKGDGTTEYGIQVTDSEGIAITGNVFDNWATAIVLRSTTTVNDVTISGNIFRQCAVQITNTGGGTFGERITAIGNPGLVRSGCEGFDYINYTRDVIAAHGTGAPGGTLTAGIGSTYRRRDGGAGTSFYVSEAGGTAWVGK
jgi:hypothetical protein